MISLKFTKIIFIIQECKIGRENNYALELDASYRGNVVLNTSSRIVSILSFSNFGFVAVFAASEDEQVHKVREF